MIPLPEGGPYSDSCKSVILLRDNCFISLIFLKKKASTKGDRFFGKSCEVFLALFRLWELSSVLEDFVDEAVCH